ncbi:hypothetical protein OOT00_04110 [Desulfobotulus sp. H1]|uniref:Uncharacterized protein n=1 Tax=Desulfobotulus pelophilus TaxID=2823377 RepID=A0ABT3N803_9BACT|nr:hypothetical protein [Desulfobotulus pelophilus]MCW7753167.1 hypothetical protein [Desulfobotulus pelophilus]
MVKACNENIEKTLVLADQMLALADKGDEEREDVGCGVLYGILRDTGYRLKQLAEKEKASHMFKGSWPD